MILEQAYKPVGNRGFWEVYSRVILLFLTAVPIQGFNIPDINDRKRPLGPREAAFLTLNLNLSNMVGTTTLTLTPSPSLLHPWALAASFLFLTFLIFRDSHEVNHF